MIFALLVCFVLCYFYVLYSEALTENKIKRIKIDYKTDYDGSNVKYTPGAYHFKDVCVHDSNSITYFGDKHNKIIESGTSTWINIKRADAEDWVQETKNKIQDETLMLINFDKNPAHCLQDQFFSVILDAYKRNKIGYNHFYFDGDKKIKKNNWCYNLFEHSGLIHSRITEPSCYKRLVLPRMVINRFPIDWNNQSAAPGNKQFIKRIHSGKFLQYNHSPGMFPLNVLTDVRSDLFESFKDKPLKTIKNMSKVLVYNRRGTSRRIWQNSNETVEILKDMNYSVTHVGREWEQFSFEKQARVYNDHGIIIAPHGAHLSNLIFAANGTLVIELNPTMKTELKIENAVNDEEKFGVHSWSSTFSRRLGITHYHIGKEHLVSKGNTFDSKINLTQFF